MVELVLVSGLTAHPRLVAEAVYAPVLLAKAEALRLVIDNLANLLSGCQGLVSDVVADALEIAGLGAVAELCAAQQVRDGCAVLR